MRALSLTIACLGYVALISQFIIAAPHLGLLEANEVGAAMPAVPVITPAGGPGTGPPPCPTGGCVNDGTDTQTWYPYNNNCTLVPGAVEAGLLYSEDQDTVTVYLCVTGYSFGLPITGMSYTCSAPTVMLGCTDGTPNTQPACPSGNCAYAG